MKIAKRLFRSFGGSGESGWIRLGLAVAAMSAYILAFIPPFTPEEYRIVELAATPVVVCAWLFGFWGGTAAAVIIIPFNAFLLSLVAGGTFGAVMGQLRGEELLPAILLLVLGAVLGGLRDIADQMRRESVLRSKAEEACRRIEERYRFVADTVSDGILALDQDRVILSANRGAARIFGSSSEELAGQSFRMLIPERVRDDHDTALRQYLDLVVAGNPDYALPIAGLGTGDREVALEISFSGFAEDNRDVFIGVVRNVTEREPLHPPAHAGVGGSVAAAMASLDPPSEPTILFVDDSPSSRGVVEEMIVRRPDMEILAAMKGKEGLELARDRAPDLILLDLNLPDMHGSEAMRRIREDSLLSRTPVIILGVDSPGDQGVQLLDAGAQACVPKPLDPAELLRTVDRVLGA